MKNKKKREKKAVICCITILSVIIIASLFAFLSPYDPDQVDLMHKFEAPGFEHWFGTDNYGRDYFTRAIYGGRVSLLVGVFSMIVSIIVGTIYGIISGYTSGLVDAVMMRFVDILMAVPSFLIIITLNVYLNAGMTTMILTIGFFSWMGIARIVRAEVLSLRERDFVLAAKGLGAGTWWLITKHFVRNVISPVMVAASISIANAILTESTLSYLGFGIKTPKASWGSMLQDAQTYILSKPMLAFYPGCLILVTVLCFNVLGDTLKNKVEVK